LFVSTSDVGVSMKFGLPWSAKDLRPEARDSARDAARRAGMPVDEWLNAVILQQAAEQDADSQSHARGEGAGDNYSGLHGRADNLARRMDQAVHRNAPAPQPPQRSREDAEQVAELIARLEQRFDQFSTASPAPLPPMPQAQPQPGLDRAIAEIAARRRALNGEPAPARPQHAAAASPVSAPPPAYTPPPHPAPTQNIAHLEDELRRITNQLEALRQPGIEAAINALRTELGSIGRTLNEAMPRRAIETIERQIQDLTLRIAEGRQAGVDSNALAGVERGLCEVRDVLRGLTPAENLVGYNDAINALSHKIDLIVAQQDPATMMQLENSLATLREMAAHVASNEAVGLLSGQVQSLAGKVDQLAKNGPGNAISNLERRIEEVSRTLAERTQKNDVVPQRIEAMFLSLSDKIEQMQQPRNDSAALAQIESRVAKLAETPPIEPLVQSLSAKIEQIQQMRTDSAALAQLEDRISKLTGSPQLESMMRSLSDKIEQMQPPRSDSAMLAQLDDRIGKLPGSMQIESMMRSLSDKIEQLQQSRVEPAALVHLEDRIVKLMERLDASDSRLGHIEAIERGVADLLVHIEDIRANKAPTALRAEDASNINALKQDVARTQNTVQAMHGTLGQVVDRLGTIEKEIQGERQRAAVPNFENLDFTPPAAPRVAPPPPTNIAVPNIPRAPELPPQISVPTAPRPAMSVPADMLASISAALAPPGQEPAAAPFATPRLPTPAPAQINPDVLPDLPLEPGSGPPRAGNTPGERIAASEAALGSARPAVTTLSAKSDFIAAARRAAQAAGQEPKGRPARADTYRSGDNPSLRSKVLKRVKSLFLAASIVAIVIGSIHFAGNIFDFGFFDVKNGKVSEDTGTSAGDDAGATAEADADSSASLADGLPPLSSPVTPAKPDADVTASLLGPPTIPLSMPPKVESKAVATAPVVQPPATTNPAPRPVSPAGNPSTLSAPLLGVPPQAKTDVTGSVSRAPADANRQAPTAAQPAGDALPASIGGPRLRNAAIAGDANAAYEVATRFAEGRGVPMSLEQAAHWYEIAAGKGLTPAQFRYASMLEKGQGVKRDLESARKLYIAAAGKGHAKAMHNLAVLYAEGVDGKPDYASAAQWFRKAAEHGVPDSQYNLAVLAARGIGMDRNIAESYKWFALAAAQGDKDAGRKRDEVATQLDAQTLAGMQQAVKTFTAQAQPAEAINVPEPQGGWDRTSVPAQDKPRAAKPLAISAFNSGKL